MNKVSTCEIWCCRMKEILDRLREDQSVLCYKEGPIYKLELGYFDFSYWIPLFTGVGLRLDRAEGDLLKQMKKWEKDNA